MTTHAHESEVYRRVYKGPDGERRTVRTWSIRFRCHLGAVRRLHGFETEREAQKTLHRLEAVVDRLRERMPVTRADAAWLRSLAGDHRDRLTEWGVIEASAIDRAKPLDECLDDWRRSLEAKERNPRDLDQRVRRVQRMLSALGWHDAADINADELLRHLHALREERRPNTRGQQAIAGDPRELVSVRACAERLGKSWATVNGWIRRGAPCQSRDGKTVVSPVRISAWAAERQKSRPISATSSNHYLSAMKAFCGWLEEVGRIDRSPMRRVKGVNVEQWKSRRRREGGKNTERRALEPDEVRRLLEGALTRERCGVPPEHQRAIILLAVTTGMRLSEIASLRAGDFDLAGRVAVVEAGYSKRGRRDEFHLREEVVEALRPLLARKAPATPAFVMPSRHTAAKMIRSIAAEAGVPEYDAAGRRLDFHCLRHTFITALVRGGVDAKVAQTLARHSTPTLTLGVYSHASTPHLVDSLGRLPDYTRPSEAVRQRQAAGAETPRESVRCAESARSTAQHRPELPNIQRSSMDATSTPPEPPTLGITDREADSERAIAAVHSRDTPGWDGRVVDCVGLENRPGARGGSGAIDGHGKSSGDGGEPVRVGAAPDLRAVAWGELHDELKDIASTLPHDALERLVQHARDLDELTRGGGHV